MAERAVIISRLHRQMTTTKRHDDHDHHRSRTIACIPTDSRRETVSHPYRQPRGAWDGDSRRNPQEIGPAAFPHFGRAGVIAPPLPFFPFFLISCDTGTSDPRGFVFQSTLTSISALAETQACLGN